MFGAFARLKPVIITQSRPASGLTIMQTTDIGSTAIPHEQSGRFSITPEFASLGATFFSEKNG
jgi:hypothetical protein